MDALWREDVIGKVRGEYAGLRVPRILTFPTTLAMLADTGASLARIGDGELRCAAMTRGPAFQKLDADLADAIRRILSEPNPDCIVGIARPHYYRCAAGRTTIDSFVSGYWANEVRQHHLLDLMRLPFYADACVSIPRHHYALPPSYWRSFFDAVRAFFSKRPVMLVTGDPRVTRGKHPMLREFAKEVREIPCPARNAWAERKRIMDDLRRLNADGSWMVALSCGPAATAIAWELSHEMQCIDIGHMPREYECFLDGIDPETDCANFYGS